MPSDLLNVVWVVSLPVAILLALTLAGSSAGRAPVRTAVGALVALGGFVFDVGAWVHQQDLASWQPVPARVVLSDRGASRNDWSFQYEYTVDGRAYRGSRLSYAPHTRSRSDTDLLAETYPVDREITVHVDPDEPSRSVVHAEPRYTLPAVGFAIHGLLAAAAWRGWRRGLPGQ